jgi:glycosyltransferase involved in cell wall biosynthesis
MDGIEISVVIPLNNEEDNIPELYREIDAVCRQKGYAFEIILVDDGSADHTLEKIRELAAAHPQCRYLSLKRNYGQTAALAAGLDQARGDIIVTMDGDLQNDPADIPALVSKLGDGYDLVNGWRRRRRDPILASVLPSLVANAFIRKITGVNLHDTGCTLKAFRKEVLEDLHLYGEMHRFIPALLHWSGARIGELPVNHRPRTRGRSKYTLSKLPRVILDLINIKFLISYSTRPIQIFGKWGMYALLLALGSLGLTCGMKILQGVDMTGNPLLYLSIFLGFVGFQFLTMGLLGEINIRIYHESTQRKIYRVAEASTPVDSWKPVIGPGASQAPQQEFRARKKS